MEIVCLHCIAVFASSPVSSPASVDRIPSLGPRRQHAPRAELRVLSFGKYFFFLYGRTLVAYFSAVLYGVSIGEAMLVYCYCIRNTMLKLLTLDP